MLDRFDRFSQAIAEISHCRQKIAGEEMAKYGLRSPHATYLTALFRYPKGLAVPELCHLCGKDKSDASRMLSILEEKGFVKKQSVDGSLYRGVLVLTDSGRQAAEQVCRRVEQAVEWAGKDLTDETRDIFYSALFSVAANLRHLSEQGFPL